MLVGISEILRCRNWRADLVVSGELGLQSVFYIAYIKAILAALRVERRVSKSRLVSSTSEGRLS